LRFAEHEVLERSSARTDVSAMVSIPTAAVRGAAFMIAGIIVLVLSIARVGSGLLALGVVLTMRAFRPQA
jgi:hypothetical protein